MRPGDTVFEADRDKVVAPVLEALVVVRTLADQLILRVPDGEVTASPVVSTEPGTAAASTVARTRNVLDSNPLLAGRFHVRVGPLTTLGAAEAQNRLSPSGRVITTVTGPVIFRILAFRRIELPAAAVRPPLKLSEPPDTICVATGVGVGAPGGSNGVGVALPGPQLPLPR